MSVNWITMNLNQVKLKQLPDLYSYNTRLYISHSPWYHRSQSKTHRENFGPMWARRSFISMGLCKKDVTPLLTHWSYAFLAQTHHYVDVLTLVLRVSMAYLWWLEVLQIQQWTCANTGPQRSPERPPGGANQGSSLAAGMTSYTEVACEVCDTAASPVMATYRHVSNIRRTLVGN